MAASPSVSVPAALEAGPDTYPRYTLIRGQYAVYDREPDGRTLAYLYRPGQAAPVAVFGPHQSLAALHAEIVRRIVYGRPPRASEGLPRA